MKNNEVKKCFMLFKHQLCSFSRGVCQCRILSVVIMLMCTCALSAQSINDKISFELNNQSLEKGLQQVAKSSGFHISYAIPLVSKYGNINISRGTRTVGKTLDLLLANTGLKYVVINKNIVINQEDAVSRNMKVLPQKHSTNTISGIVTDAEGDPLIGVAVRPENSSLGTITDSKGYFQLSVDADNATLLITYVGKKDIKMRAKKGSTLRIKMQDDVNVLNEVIVTGYQTISKERATGAYGTIRRDQLESKLNSDLKNIIEGQVAGVVLDKEGNLSIRGTSTLSAESTPLIVVDGYPTECSLSDLNPDNIDNITVLKDGVAASIYGSRSANGVIVVTTKQGRKGKTTISYKGSFKFESKPDLDYLHLASTSDYIDAEMALYDLNPSSSIYNISYKNNNQSTVNYLLVQKKSGLINESQFNEQIAKLRGINVLDQMEKYMFRTAFTQTHNLSINGGNDTDRYNLAINYMNNRSTFINTHDNRLLIDLKNEWAPYKFLTIGVTANINYSRSTSPRTSWKTLTDMTSYIKPYSLLEDENGLTDINTVSYAKQQLFDTYSGMKSYSYNPITDAYQDYINDQSFQTRLSGFLRFNIIDGLNLEFGGNWTHGNAIHKQISEANSYRMRLAFNNGTSMTTPSTHYVPDGDMIDETRSSNENWTIRTQINFAREFGKHRVSALAGNEIRRITNDNNQYATRLGYNSTAGSFTPVNIKDFNAGVYTSDMLGGKDLYLSNGSYGLRDNRFVSWYFNGSYEYDNRYLISGSIREDLTNFFGTDPKYRHKPMWSIGATWKLKNEKFFNVDLIDRLDIRASYGINGNISLSQGPYLILSTGSWNEDTEGVSYGISSYPNKTLRWEKTTTLNLGLDMDILKNRLGFSFDYYFKKSTDLLAPDAMDPTTGATSLTKNVGQINNRGYELALHAVPVKTADFEWNVNYNLSINKNKVIEYNVSRKYPSSYAYTTTVNVAGYPMNGLWGYHFAGLNDKGAAQAYKADGTVALLTATKVTDVYYQGTVTPKYDMSLTNKFTYKNWDLSFMFIAKLGHKYRKDCFQGSNINSRYVSQRWQKAGDEKNTIYPVLKSWNMDMFRFPFCDVNLGNASYAKLRDVTLSYAFDKSFVRHIGMNNARIYLQARNLFRITAKGCEIDPETMEVNTDGGMGTSSNGGYTVLPLNKEFYIGVSFTF